MVEQTIRESGPDLVNGLVGRVAGVIIARLVREYRFTTLIPMEGDWMLHLAGVVESVILENADTLLRNGAGTVAAFILRRLWDTHRFGRPA